MHILKVNKVIFENIKDYLDSNQLAYALNGDAFELSISEKDSFDLGRFYQQTITEYNGKVELQEKDKQGENAGGLKS